MIHIDIKEEFGSIKPYKPFELENFIIITGKNGSGKSHLLKALSINEISKVLLSFKNEKFL